MSAETLNDDGRRTRFGVAVGPHAVLPLRFGWVHPLTSHAHQPPATQGHGDVAPLIPVVPVALSPALLPQHYLCDLEGCGSDAR